MARPKGSRKTKAGADKVKRETETQNEDISGNGAKESIETVKEVQNENTENGNSISKNENGVDTNLDATVDKVDKDEKNEKMESKDDKNIDDKKIEGNNSGLGRAGTNAECAVEVGAKKDTTKLMYKYITALHRKEKPKKKGEDKEQVPLEKLEEFERIENELSAAKSELEKFQNRTKELEEELKKRSAEILELQGKLQDASDKAIEEEDEAISKKSERIEEIKSILEKTSGSEREALEKELETLTEFVDGIKRKKEERETLQRLSDEIKRKNEEIENLKKSNLAKMKYIAAMQRRRAEEENQRIKAEVEKEVQKRNELLEKIKKLEEELKRKDEEIQKSKSGLQPAIQHDVQVVQSSDPQIEVKLKAYEEELNRLKEEIAKKDADLDTLKKGNVAMMKYATALQKKKFEEEIAQIKSQLEDERAKRVAAEDELEKMRAHTMEIATKGMDAGQKQYFEGKEKEIVAKEKELLEKEKELREMRKNFETDSIRLKEMEERLKKNEQELLILREELERKSKTIEQENLRIQKKEEELNKLKDMLGKEVQSKASTPSVTEGDGDAAQYKKQSVAMMKYVTALQKKKQEEELKSLKEALENEIKHRNELEALLKKKDEELKLVNAGAIGPSGADVENIKKRYESDLKAKQDALKEKEMENEKLKVELEKAKKDLAELEKEIVSGTGTAVDGNTSEQLKAKDNTIRILEDTLRATKLELKDVKEQLEFKLQELDKLKELVKFKEDEFNRFAADLRYREEKTQKELDYLRQLQHKMGDITKIDDLKREIERLEFEVKKKEEEIKAREEYLRNKERELQIKEQALVEEDLKKAEKSRTLEIQSQKAKTGTSRLDDLLFGGLPYGSNSLLIGPPFIGKETVMYCFICEGIKKGIPAIILTTDASPSDIREDAKQVLGTFEDYEKLGLVKYIDTYSKSMGIEEQDPNAYYVENVNDYKEILKAVEQVSRAIKEKSNTYRMAVCSLSTLITYSDTTQCYRFLQTLTGKNKRAKVTTVYTIDRGMHSETEIQMLGHVMDGSIEFKQEGTKTLLSIQGICDVQSRAWIQYSYSKSGINIGSFSLDKIR